MRSARHARITASFIAFFLTSAFAQAATIFSCPMDPAGVGDQVDRGFYVTNYAGSTLDTVTMQFIGNVAESKTLTLTAAAGVFGGLVIGSAVASGVVPTSGAGLPLTFNFGNAPVVPGSTVTFALTLNAGAVPVFYNVGVGPCPGVTQTNGTTPPLDSVRRDSVGLVITGLAALPASNAVPALSPATLAILALMLAGSALYLRRRMR
jgi:hypothetical protein